MSGDRTGHRTPDAGKDPPDPRREGPGGEDRSGDRYAGARFAQEAVRAIGSLAGEAVGGDCPLCRARERVGQVRPETWERLATAAGDLVQALVEVLDPVPPGHARAGDGPRPGTTDGRADPRCPDGPDRPGGSFDRDGSFDRGDRGDRGGAGGPDGGPGGRRPPPVQEIDITD